MSTWRRQRRHRERLSFGEKVGGRAVGKPGLLYRGFVSSRAVARSVARGFSLPASAKLGRALGGFRGTGRGPLAPFRRLPLMLRCAAFCASGPASERADRLAVVVAVVRADDRLFAEHGVRIHCSRGALHRLVELANPPDDRPHVPPDAVVRRRVRAPARRLVRFHGKAKRGDVIAVEQHPTEQRTQLRVLRRD